MIADISGADLPITHQWGYVDEPGRWDHWPSGFVACFPNGRTAEGRIVLQPGDALIPWQRYVQDAVTIEVEKGYITKISGAGTDAHVLNDYFEAWNDNEVWATSHMGWGLLPHARWSTGSNRFADRETPAHLDVPMRGCTVEIDGAAVVRDGALVVGSKRCGQERARKGHPGHGPRCRTARAGEGATVTRNGTPGCRPGMGRNHSVRKPRPAARRRTQRRFDHSGEPLVQR
ncbi:hypothetical protein [Nocardia carnea]|uniref:hypothetical protein n=1 Tax=Nocardia carnea TaxID=37328 RepID=UPI003D7AAD63